ARPPRVPRRRTLGSGAPVLRGRDEVPALRPLERSVRDAGGERGPPRSRREVREGDPRALGRPPGAREALRGRGRPGARPEDGAAAPGARLHALAETLSALR